MLVYRKGEVLVPPGGPKKVLKNFRGSPNVMEEIKRGKAVKRETQRRTTFEGRKNLRDGDQQKDGKERKKGKKDQQNRRKRL